MRQLSRVDGHSVKQVFASAIEQKCWKLLGLPSLFSRQAELDQAAKDAAHAQQIHELYAEIGKLSTQLAWLKKKAGHLVDES